MYTLREGPCHIQGIGGGCFILLGTDHLNDLLVNSSVEPRQPAKVLRWWLEIAQVRFFAQCFILGTSSLFADMASRRPPVRMRQSKGLLRE